MSEPILANTVFIRKAISKIYSKRWKQEAGIALHRTAGILYELEELRHIYAVLGGALAIGSIVLNVNTNSRDLIKEKRALDDAKSHFAGVVEKALTWRLEEIEERLCDPEKEVIENYEAIKRTLQHEFGEISMVMTMMERFMPNTSNINSELPDDMLCPDFKHVLQAIEATYESFQNGAYNISHYFSTKPYYMFHLQTLIEKQLSPIKVQEHLDFFFKCYGYEKCKEVLSFVILSLSKNLQLVSAFFLCQHDLKRLVFGFERFNDFCEKFFKIFAGLTGEEFLPQRTLPPRSSSLSKPQSNNKNYFHTQNPSLDRTYLNLTRKRSKSSQDLRDESIKSASKALDRVKLSYTEGYSQISDSFQDGSLYEFEKLESKFNSPETTLWENHEEKRSPFEQDLKSPNRAGINLL